MSAAASSDRFAWMRRTPFRRSGLRTVLQALSKGWMTDEADRAELRAELIAVRDAGGLRPRELAVAERILAKLDD